MKKAIVLKSLRTQSGAKDWIKVFGKNYTGELKVIDTDTLKSYPEFDGYLESYPLTNHVVIEEDLTPIVSVIKEGEIGELVKAFVSKGFMEVGAHGPCFTDKWYEAIDKYVSNALADAFKSMSEYKYEFSGEVNDVTGDFLVSVGNIIKAVEDAEALANSGEATENADFGHELRTNKPISDGEVKTAEAKTASQAGGDADTSDSKLNGKAVSDSEVKTATHKGDHNKGGVTKSSHGKEPNEVTQEDVQGTDEPEAVDDEAAGKAVDKKAAALKSAGEFEPEAEATVNTVFKSLSEAKRWKNPDRNRYHVVPTSFEDKKKYGRNKNYIVKEKAPQPLIGSFGNKR